MSPTAKKKFRERALRAKRELERERSTGGFLRDGAGRRYRIGVYFLLAGDLDRTVEAFDGFDEEFQDDIGEPVFHLYGSLAAHRHGEIEKARARLLAAMLSNPYLLPSLIGQPLEPLDIWHSSNWQQPSYLVGVEEFLAEPTAQERQWIRTQLCTGPFMLLHEGYVATFHALKNERDISRRREILGRWERLRAAHGA